MHQFADDLAALLQRYEICADIKHGNVYFYAEAKEAGGWQEIAVLDLSHFTLFNFTDPVVPLGDYTPSATVTIEKIEAPGWRDLFNVVETTSEKSVVVQRGYNEAAINTWAKLRYKAV